METISGSGCIARSPIVMHAFRRVVGRAAAMLFLIFVIALLSAFPVHADSSGLVVTVHDGDTITVRIGERMERVRLFGIDAPERGQAYGNVARKALASRIDGRMVRIVDHGRDSYGRLVAGVFLDGNDVNAELVQQGLAWVFRRYSQDAALIAYEVEARAAGRGLWRERNPVAPWNWRGRHAPAPVPAPLTGRMPVPAAS